MVRIIPLSIKTQNNPDLPRKGKEEQFIAHKIQRGPRSCSVSLLTIFVNQLLIERPPPFEFIVLMTPNIYASVVHTYKTLKQ